MQDGDEKEFRLTLDDITKLIDAGREVNALIPHDVHSSEELDDTVTTIGTRNSFSSPSCMEKRVLC